MNKETLIEQMQQGIVEFAYKKKDGSIRQARGTLSEEYINYEFKTDSARPRPEGLITYFDIDSDGWRSFYEQNLVVS